MSSLVLKGFLDRPPKGYRPGDTLGRALSELRASFESTPIDDSSARLCTGDGLLNCSVQERLDKYFLMHIVNLEFSTHVTAAAVPGARIKIRNTGMLLRTGIVCSVPARYRSAFAEVAQVLENDPALKRALMVLDFRHCELIGTDKGWTVRLQPIGLSEVVNRVPPFKRYIRLGEGQPDALMTALRSFKRLLSSSGTT